CFRDLLQSIFIQNTSLNNTLPFNYNNRIFRLSQLIEENYINKRKFFLSDSLSLSERHINEICVENTGETVKRLIIDRTITEAKGLLVSGNYLIKEITYSLGYSNPAYFSRIFKKKTNLTPEDNYNL